MKILQIHFDPPSTKFGTGNFIFNFSRKLIENNFKTTNLCSNRYDFENFGGCSIKYTSFRLKRRLPLITFIYEFLFLEIYSFLYLLKNISNYNIVMSYGEVGFLCSILCKIFKKKYVKYFFVIYKDLVYLRQKEINLYKKNNSNLKTKVYSLLNKVENIIRICLERYFIKYEKNFITASKLTKKRLRPNKGKKILVNYYYHNLDKRKHYSNTNNSKKNLLLIGNDIYLKGLLKFLHVIKKHYSFYLKNTNVFVVGISNMKEFKSYIEYLNLSEIINYKTHSNKIDDFYDNVDLFVNLSNIEGWNISIMDAYLKKIKIFSTRVGCINELFKNDENIKKCCKYNLNKINDDLKKFIIKEKKFNINHYEALLNKLKHEEISKKYIEFFKNI